jgi:hypothetical protein
MATPDTEGIKRARVVAEWNLGDSEWGDIIVRAYLDESDPNYADALSELVSDSDGESGDVEL